MLEIEFFDWIQLNWCSWDGDYSTSGIVQLPKMNCETLKRSIQKFFLISIVAIWHFRQTQFSTKLNGHQIVKCVSFIFLIERLLDYYFRLFKSGPKCACLARSNFLKKFELESYSLSNTTYTRTSVICKNDVKWMRKSPSHRSFCLKSKSPTKPIQLRNSHLKINKKKKHNCFACELSIRRMKSIQNLN